MKIILLKKNNSHDSNTYLLTHGNSSVLIDASADVQTLKDALAENNSQLHAIFLTHSHFDHILYLDELINAFDCKVYIHKNGKDKLYSKDTNLSYMAEPFAIKNKTNIITCEDNDEIIAGAHVIKVIHTPGHSNCSTCFQTDGVLFTGDILFINCIGRFDLFTSSIDDMKQSLAKLLALPPYEKYYAGHSRNFDYNRAKTTLDKNMESLS